MDSVLEGLYETGNCVTGEETNLVLCDAMLVMCFYATLQWHFLHATPEY